MNTHLMGFCKRRFHLKCDFSIAAAYKFAFVRISEKYMSQVRFFHISDQSWAHTVSGKCRASVGSVGRVAEGVGQASGKCRAMSGYSFW